MGLVVNTWLNYREIDVLNNRVSLLESQIIDSEQIAQAQNNIANMKYIADKLSDVQEGEIRLIENIHSQTREIIEAKKMK